MNIDISWLAAQFPDLERVRPLSRGGQKWVFRAEDDDYGAVVLKLIQPGGEEYSYREVEAVERISSTNIPRVYRIGTISSPLGELVWMLEEFIEGRVLSTVLRSGPLPKRDLLRVATGLVQAAAAAEEVEVVHRDIKPKNIIVDANGNTYLLDFGIARILDMESLTATDAAQGPHSPGYGAPEQFIYDKSRIDGRSDLFAIGVVLHEAATGRNPFLDGQPTVEEALRRVAEDPLPQLQLDWDDNGVFADFVSSLTQKAAWQRPESCAYAKEWLQEIVDNLGHD